MSCVPIGGHLVHKNLMECVKNLYFIISKVILDAVLLGRLY